MSKKKLLTLAKELDFTAEWQYYQYIIDSWYNGQKQQVLQLYKQMKKEDKKEFIVMINDNSTITHEITQGIKDLILAN